MGRLQETLRLAVEVPAIPAFVATAAFSAWMAMGDYYPLDSSPVEIGKALGWKLLMTAAMGASVKGAMNVTEDVANTISSLHAAPAIAQEAGRR